jgi:hypothetical protein
MAAFTQGCRLAEILVNAVMAQHVISAQPDRTLDEIEERMAAHAASRDGNPRRRSTPGIITVWHGRVRSSTQNRHGAAWPRT